jgi:hypothetical protein
VVEWLLPGQPKVAEAITRSGAVVGDHLKLELRRLLTDVARYPEAAARSAIGRALGSVLLRTGDP